jgi:hypothetical protein
MIIFRFSAALFALAVAGCGIGGFKPRNDLEAMLQGNVGEAIANLERYISQNAKNPKKVESELLQAGFTKAEFVKYSILQLPSQGWSVWVWCGRESLGLREGLRSQFWIHCTVRKQ